MSSVVIYARVSTADDRQTVSNQLLACREYAARAGHTVHAEYSDHASATDMRGRRAWRAMVADLAYAGARTRPKAVVCARLDRFCRSVADYVHITERMGQLGVVVVTADGQLSGIDDDAADPYRAMMAQVLASFAQFERELIRARVKEGIARARSRGVTLGRRRVEIDAAAYDALEPGVGLREAARRLGVNHSTLGRWEAANVRKQARGRGRKRVSETGSGKQGSATSGEQRDRGGS